MIEERCCEVFVDTCYDAGDPRKNFGMLEHELRIEVIVCHIL